MTVQVTLTARRYFCIDHGAQRVFRFEIIITVSVSSFRFIWLPMLWVYGHYTYIYSSSAGIDFRRQNLTSTDVRFWRLKSIPALIYDYFKWYKNIWSPWFIQKYFSVVRVGTHLSYVGDHVNGGSVVIKPHCARSVCQLMNHCSAIYVSIATQIKKEWEQLYQEADDVYPMLVQCWSSVVDGGPTLNQHWSNILCQQPCSRPNTNPRHSPNAGLMLGQRRRRWPNIKPALGDICLR